MQKMGFSATWINWIKRYITYVKYHVMMNGRNRGNIVPEGGLYVNEILCFLSFLFYAGKRSLAFLIMRRIKEDVLVTR